MPSIPPIVTFCAPSNTGKTTLIERVIPHLVSAGLRVAALKHDAHRLELDVEGKDTWRFRKAGAWRSLIASSSAMGLFSSLDGEASVVGLVERFLDDADLIVTEGFGRAGLPAIRVHRAARPPDARWVPPPKVIAWASDVRVETDVPVLPLDEPEAVAAFLLERFVTRAGPRVATAVLPMATIADRSAASTLAGVAAKVCEGRVLQVVAVGAEPLPGFPYVFDLRPNLGPLGALLTGLSAVDTPYVLFVGQRHATVAEGQLRSLLEAGSARADVIAPTDGPHREPLLAVYGHRCLSAIQASLLSGSARMDNWWGNVRVALVPASDRAASPS